MKDKIKLLVIGDFVAPTGFATVNHNIFTNLPQEDYDIHVLGINYFGDPHEFPFKIFPASPGNSAALSGDMYGLNRLPQFLNMDFDVIYILNDLWITTVYLEIIKAYYKELPEKKIPKVVIYFPVDGEGYPLEWFKHIDIVDTVVVYTQFGYEVVTKTKPDLVEKLFVIPHGTDTQTFYPLDKLSARAKIYPQNSEIWNDEFFIVLNVNRNQTRKRLDLSLMGFALFALDKPMTVRYHHHAGLKDAGWDIISLTRSIDQNLRNRGLDSKLEERLIVTSKEIGPQRVSTEHLNLIYNAADIGINTSTGEGWGLTNTEHAVCRKAQIVPNHTACAELFGEFETIIPIELELYDNVTNLRRYLVSPEGLARQLNILYNDRKLLQEKAEAVYNKFSSSKYNWKEIAKTWDKIFKS